jgi:hypothetical protein
MVRQETIDTVRDWRVSGACPLSLYEAIPSYRDLAGAVIARKEDQKPSAALCLP